MTCFDQRSKVFLQRMVHDALFFFFFTFLWDQGSICHVEPLPSGFLRDGNVHSLHVDLWWRCHVRGKTRLRCFKLLWFSGWLLPQHNLAFPDWQKTGEGYWSMQLRSYACPLYIDYGQLCVILWVTKLSQDTNTLAGFGILRLACPSQLITGWGETVPNGDDDM